MPKKWELEEDIAGLSQALVNVFRWWVWSVLWGVVALLILGGVLGYHILFQHSV